MKQVYLKNIALDVKSGSIVIIITVVDSVEYVPIWIGNAEALAIVLGEKGMKTARPMTHDLMLSMIDGFGGRLDKVVISGYRDETFYALVYIEDGEKIIVLDARPSDSIALAIRANVSIFIDDGLKTINPEFDVEEDEAIWSNLKIINTDDFITG